MTFSELIRIVRSRWYAMIAGLIFSVAIAGVACSFVPPVYTSSGAALLMEPRQRPSVNPLLNFDSGLTMTSSILVQALNAPDVAKRLQHYPGDSYTAKNVDSSSPGQQPIIYVTTRSRTPEGSVELVSNVLGMASQNLVDRQRELRLLTTRYIKLESLVAPTDPKFVVGPPALVAGVVFVLGLTVTVVLVLVLERRVVARRRVPARRAEPHAYQDGHTVTGTISTEYIRRPPTSPAGRPAFARNASISSAQLCLTPGMQDRDCRCQHQMP
jgi:capsular polysaccharide biosynthesis protein